MSPHAIDIEEVLRAFSRCHKLNEEEWVIHRKEQLHMVFIDTLLQFHAAVNEPGLVGRFKRAGCYGGSHPTWSTDTILKLRNFLPGPISARCLEHAWEAVLKVEAGTAKTKYIHRGQGAHDQGLGKEEYLVPGAHGRLFDGKPDDGLPSWTLFVDCAGFIRNVYETITDSVLADKHLSNRRFMRADDFYEFFSKQPSVKSSANIATQWRSVDNICDVLPGDIISYSFGCFVEKHNLRDLLQDVKLQMDLEDAHDGTLRHFLEEDDNSIDDWVDKVEQKLNAVGVDSKEALLEKLTNNTLNGDLRNAGLRFLGSHTLEELKEACEASHSNTGHIVIVRGPPKKKEDDKWTVPILQSTSLSKPPGVGQNWKIFCEDPESGTWIHANSKAPVSIGRLV